MSKKRWLAAPYVVWMVIFTVIPLGVVAYFALTDSINGGFTLKNLANVGTYLPIFLRSVGLSLISALVCLLIGYPVAYCIAQAKPSAQRLLYLLIMLPMCMSFLLRTLAWVALLEDTGIINSFLGKLGIGPLPLVRNYAAVVLGMVYNLSLIHIFRLEPDAIHVMHKSQYSGQFGDYSSYSAEYDEMADSTEEEADE